MSKTVLETTGEYLDHLKVEKNVSKLTIRNYRHYLSRFLWWCESGGRHLERVEDVNQDLVRKYRVWLADFVDDKGEGLKTVTQSYHVIALRSWLRWLIKNDYVTLSPDKVDLPKGESRSLKFLNTDQMERLMAMPSIGTPQGLRDRAILEMLFSTGLRVSELVKLDREKIDLKRREFGVIGKGRKLRLVFLSERAAKWVERYLITRDDEWEAVFINYKKKGLGSRSEGLGEESSKQIRNPESEMLRFDLSYGEKRRLTARSVQRIVKHYAKKAKLPVEITPHGLRHTFATDLLMAGADLRSVQELLRHKNIATIQVYTHVTNKQLKNVHEAFHGKGK